jgi:hypothetical protein
MLRGDSRAGKEAQQGVNYLVPFFAPRPGGRCHPARPFEVP